MPGPKVRVKMEGLDLLAKRLRVLPDSIQGRKLGKATEDGAEILAEFMRALAPRGDGNPHAYEFIVANQNVQAVRGNHATRSQYDVGPTGRGFYLTFHETGTLYLAPQPFMRPAAESSESEVVDTVRDSLARELKLAARRR